MPWNGSGVFSRVYSWAADRDAGLDILADRMDSDTNDIAQGLMHCLTVNGETVPTANLPMNNYRHTGASAGVAATDYVTVGQLQAGGGAFGAGFLPLSGGTMTGELILNAADLILGDNSTGYIVRNSTGGNNPNTINFLGAHGGLLSGMSLGANLVSAAGNLVIGGTGIDYVNYYGGHLIAFGWDGVHLQVYVDNIANGAIVTPNYTGNLSVSGNLNAGGSGSISGNLSVAGSATVNGTVTAAQLTSTGNLYVSGSGAITGGWNAGGLTSAGNIQSLGGYVYVGTNYMQDQGGRIYHNTNMQMGGGTYWKPGGGGFTDPSDSRLKRDVVAYACGLDQILRLRPIEFQYNGRGGMVDDGRRYVGLIANEVAAVMPEMVLPWRPAEPAPDDPDDLLGLDCSALTFALINAVKELAARLAALEAR